ncbi:MAG: hypothetical protein U0R52_06270 [Solirubrobacterales bacterium]
MLSAGPYLAGAAEVAVVAGGFLLASVALRLRLLPRWEGAPAMLIEVVVAAGLLVCAAEILGTFGLLREWALLAVAFALGGTGLALILAQPPGAESAPGAPGGGPGPPGCEPPDAASGPPAPPVPEAALLVAVGVVAVVFAHWGFEARYALDSGINNFDSLWYHMPFAVDMAQSGSTTGLHYTDTVFVNWLYPQNSELIQAVAVLLTGRDTLSLFVNFGWLAVALLAAWCVGRPYGRGPLTVTAAAVLLESHTLVVREPGAAKNDVAAAALLLASAAILLNAFEAGRASGRSPREALRPGWALGAAGLAAGLAAGTKLTVLAPVAALTVAALALSPPGRRPAAAAWWFVPALAGGGYWYLRNLLVAGNPVPQLRSLGPLSLPGPDRLQKGRPDFSVLHYATDTGVWREYFVPGLHQGFGVLWPAVVLAGLAGAVAAVLAGRTRAVRWLGAVALFGMLAYLATPLSAAGADGAPTAFAINIRFLVPALGLGLVLLPLGGWLDAGRRRWWMLAALVALMVVTDRSDAVLRDPNRLFGVVVALVAVLIPAALLYAAGRGAPRAVVLAAAAALLVAVVAAGYPLQRHYLRERFARFESSDLGAAYRWARGVSGARVGLAGSTAGFLGYGFYGTDLSNRVLYLGREGPHGAYDAIPTCAAFRAAVNRAGLDYLVTAPFLNFIHPEDPIASPEAWWLRGEPSVGVVNREGPVTVWRVRGRLDPAGCARIGAPQRYVPQTPGA